MAATAHGNPMYGKQCTSAATTAVLVLPTWVQARPWGPSWAEVSPIVARAHSTRSSRSAKGEAAAAGVEVAEAELG
jgi:hypothetical protein